MKIEDEIKQSKFPDEIVKAHVNVMFTSNWLNSNFQQALKPFDITPQQFNILRILRGQHPGPAPLKLLTERMIDRMSNTSRLVEKLRQKGLVERTICEGNRRQVDIKITDSGLQLINRASEVTEKNRKAKNNLSEKEAKELNRLLDKLRDEQ